MRQKHRWLVLLAVAGLICALLVPSHASTAVSAAQTSVEASSSTDCSSLTRTWGSLQRANQQFSSAPLIATRVGQHACFDRVVFEFNGKATGYIVQYADVIDTGGAGIDLVPYTAGGEHLRVDLLAPAYDEAGNPTYPHRVGDRVANVFPFRTLRDVVFGGSFEGRTLFATGVRARLPFRVFTLDGPGTHSRIVLDVAHVWPQ